MLVSGNKSPVTIKENNKQVIDKTTSTVQRHSSTNCMRESIREPVRLDGIISPTEATDDLILSFLSPDDVSSVSTVNQKLKKQVQRGLFLLLSFNHSTELNSYKNQKLEKLEEKRNAIVEMKENCNQNRDSVFANTLPYANDPYYDEISDQLKPESLQSLYLYAPDDLEQKIPLGINANSHPTLYFKVDRSEYNKNIKNYISGLEQLIQSGRDTTGMFSACKANAEQLQSDQNSQTVVGQSQWVRFIPGSFSSEESLYTKYDSLIKKGILKNDRQRFEFHNKVLPLYSDLNSSSPISLLVNKLKLIHLYDKLLESMTASKDSFLSITNNQGELVES